MQKPKLLLNCLLFQFQQSDFFSSSRDSYLHFLSVLDLPFLLKVHFLIQDCIFVKNWGCYAMEAENQRPGHSSEMVRPNHLKLSKNYFFIQIKKLYYKVIWLKTSLLELSVLISYQRCLPLTPMLLLHFRLHPQI